MLANFGRDWCGENQVPELKRIARFKTALAHKPTPHATFRLICFLSFRLSRLAEQILANLDSDEMTTPEKWGDLLVYQLYGLPAAVVALINLKLSGCGLGA